LPPTLEGDIKTSEDPSLPILEIKLENFPRATKSYKVVSYIKRDKTKIWSAVMEVPMSYIYLIVAGFADPNLTGQKAANKLHNQFLKDKMFELK
jgi:hypothetical protein